MSCKYCEDYTNKVKSMHDKNKESFFSLLNEYMEVVISGELVDTFKINYCPMCGKRVNEYIPFK